MTEELSSAKKMAETKIGEISIIRSNQARLEKSHDNQLNALRTSIAEGAKERQADIERAMAENRRLITENAFMKQDLDEVSHRVKELKRDSKGKTVAFAEPAPLPKKHRALPYRDGFDPEEAHISPAPKRAKRTERKQRQDGEPVVPVLNESFEPLHEDVAMQEVQEPGPMEIYHGESRDAKCVRLILQHRTDPHKVTDLEVLTTLSLPSEPDKNFSSYILEATTALSSEHFPVAYAMSILSLWGRCLDSKYYKPVSFFMEIIKFIIDLDSPRIVPRIVEYLVPVLHKSCDVNGSPRFRYSPVWHENLPTQTKQTPQSELHHEVNGTEALHILYSAIVSVQDDIDTVRRFWQIIRWDFILIMLNAYQPIDDIIIVFNLLYLSVLPTSFGPILGTEEEQVEKEDYILDRVANLLNEPLKTDEGKEPYTPWEISTFRLEAMAFLAEAAFYMNPEPKYNRTGHRIAIHRTVLPRIFRAISEEIDTLYLNPSDRTLLVALINGLVTLAHDLLHDFPAEIGDLPSKLRESNVPGASQRYLVALTRLSFVEGHVVEEGITDETVERAREILERWLTPEEAEALEVPFGER